MRRIANFYGFVYQGNAYEGLTCDALEWIASSGGGQFIDGGKVTINNAKAAAILNLQRSWVGTITPRGVTTYQEEEARNAFDAGNAAFMRNWPYAYAASQTTPVKGKFDVTVLPHSGSNTSVGTVGGWQLGVSKYSKHIGAAIELVRYLTSPARRAVRRDLQQQRADDSRRREASRRPQGESLTSSPRSPVSHA